MQPDVLLDAFAYVSVLVAVACLAIYGLRYSRSLRESHRLSEVFERNQQNSLE